MSTCFLSAWLVSVQLEMTVISDASEDGNLVLELLTPSCMMSFIFCGPTPI